jgi:hypothetical protein
MLGEKNLQAQLQLSPQAQELDALAMFWDRGCVNIGGSPCCPVFENSQALDPAYHSGGNGFPLADPLLKLPLRSTRFTDSGDLRRARY